MKTNLTGLFPEEISALLPKEKERFRGMQVFRWIHERLAESFADMTNLSKAFRAELDTRFTFGALSLLEKQTSRDRSTDKYVWELQDGKRIESVIIRDEGRTTACISSQVGCKMRCAFCRTGNMGFARDLTAGEILDQLISMRRDLRANGGDITNIVFMGMGEPLDNYDAVAKAITIINMETGLGFGLRKITVSTCGLPEKMIRLANDFKRIGLALSLNAADNELRSMLMPINRAHHLDEVLDAALEFTRITRRRVTFEYILIEHMNDSAAHARALASVVRRIPSKVNLIAFNTYGGSTFSRPPDTVIESFQRILLERNITAMIRKSRGDEILAACGQLAGEG